MLLQIDKEARKKQFPLAGHEDCGYSLLMKMKVQIDCHYKNGNRLPYELAWLYKRFINVANEQCIPEMVK